MISQAESAATLEKRAPATRTAARRAGRAARKRAPRSAQALAPGFASRDPVEILQAAEATRIPELLPLRYRRMAENPFAFLRGSAAVMAADLAARPDSGILVQACGDAHLLNFGVFAAPERRLVFDINDFDETLPAPFEWDVKRLAASIAVAARHRGFAEAVAREALSAMLGSYRLKTAQYASMQLLDVWYSRIAADNVTEIMRAVKLKARGRRMIGKALQRARSRDSSLAFAKLTETEDGRRRFRDNPPQLIRIDFDQTVVSAVWDEYQSTLSDDVRTLLGRYELLDVAVKVVGVGSVGTRCLVVLLAGDGGDDPLILQIKQADASVLEPYAGASAQGNHGHRVVAGQRLLQAAGDIFLGWARDVKHGVDYYVRQLWDGKGAVDVDLMVPAGFVAYSDLCGQTLARAHARGGQPAEISGYLGPGDSFDRAVAAFAAAYADQTQRDYRRLLAAIAAGRIDTEPAADRPAVAR